MKKIVELETMRLILRQWHKEDLEVLALLNADQKVMEFFPNVLSKKESDEMAGKIKKLISDKGWGFWAVEDKTKREFIGFVGLHEPHDDLPFNPCVEIGWRLAKKHWGKGYATEAGNTVLKFGFGKLNLNEIYSFTTVHNMKSRAVMERLGLKNTMSNFNHPAIPKYSSLREHVLYKIDKQSWALNYV